MMNDNLTEQCQRILELKSQAGDSWRTEEEYESLILEALDFSIRAARVLPVVMEALDMLPHNDVCNIREGKNCDCWKSIVSAAIEAEFGKDDGECKTCGGSGVVPALVETPTGMARCPSIGEPCPDCPPPKHQPPAQSGSGESEPIRVPCEWICPKCGQMETDELSADEHECETQSGSGEGG